MRYGVPGPGGLPGRRGGHQVGPVLGAVLALGAVAHAAPPATVGPPPVPSHLAARGRGPGARGDADTARRLVRPAVYDTAGRVREGLAAVRRGALWHVADRTGRLVIPPRHFRVDEGLVDGCARVTVRAANPCCPGTWRWTGGDVDRTGREYLDAS